MKEMRHLPLWLCLLLVCCLTACRGEQVPVGDRPVVVVSIEPLRYFTEQIAGDRMRVVTMVPGGSSPETYEPSPQQLVDLDNSVAYFRVGTLGFEQTWMAKFVDNAPGLKVYDTSEGIDPVREDRRHAVRMVTLTDPHTWTSPSGARVIARNICRALCELDSAGAPDYRRRLDSLTARIDSIDGVVRRVLAGVRHRSFLVYHPAFGHFARDYGLRQISIESEGREPTPAQLRRLVSRCRSEQVEVVLVQKEYDPSAVSQIARDVGARVATVDPLAYDWPGETARVAYEIAHGKK